MRPDDETLMAYADGELGPIESKRVEAAIAEDPAAAAIVERHRALRRRMAAGFTTVEAEPVPERFAAMLHSNVVPFPARKRPAPRRWVQGVAVAATLVLGILVGRGLPEGPVTSSGGQLRASGSLARALDTQLGGEKGPTRMLASFRDSQGRYCRVFTGAPVDGIACRQGGSWLLLQTQAAAAASGTEYRQAGSADAALLARAQELMVGEPLDASSEREARSSGWK